LEAQLLTADKLEAEADRLDEAKRTVTGLIETNDDRTLSGN
jgi:hypothetical protein